MHRHLVSGSIRWLLVSVLRTTLHDTAVISCSRQRLKHGVHCVVFVMAGAVSCVVLCSVFCDVCGDLISRDVCVVVS